MKMKKPIHPGIAFSDAYLNATNMSVTETAKKLKCSQKHLSNIINGKVGVTADMAIRIALLTNTSAKLWLNMQSNYDLSLIDPVKYCGLKNDVNISMISS